MDTLVLCLLALAIQDTLKNPKKVGVKFLDETVVYKPTEVECVIDCAKLRTYLKAYSEDALMTCGYIDHAVLATALEAVTKKKEVQLTNADLSVARVERQNALMKKLKKAFTKEVGTALASVLNARSKDMDNESRDPNIAKNKLVTLYMTKHVATVRLINKTFEESMFLTSQRALANYRNKRSKIDEFLSRVKKLQSHYANITEYLANGYCKKEYVLKFPLAFLEYFVETKQQSRLVTEYGFSRTVIDEFVRMSKTRKVANTDKKERFHHYRKLDLEQFTIPYSTVADALESEHPIYKQLRSNAGSLPFAFRHFLLRALKGRPFTYEFYRSLVDRIDTVYAKAGYDEDDEMPDFVASGESDDMYLALENRIADRLVHCAMHALMTNLADPEVFDLTRRLAEKGAARMDASSVVSTVRNMLDTKAALPKFLTSDAATVADADTEDDGDGAQDRDAFRVTRRAGMRKTRRVTSAGEDDD